METIIYIGPFRFPEKDAAASRVLNNAKIFRKLGYEVIFISWGNDYGNFLERNQLSTFQGFQYLNTNEIGDSQESVFQKLKRIFNPGRISLSQLNYLKKKDIKCIIAYNPPLIFLFKLKIFCKAERISIVSDITEWYSASDFRGGKLNIQYLLNEFNMRLLQKTVPNKIVISRYLDKYYTRSTNLILPPLLDPGEEKWKEITEKSLEISTIEEGLKFIYAGTPGKKDSFNKMLHGVNLAFQNKLKLSFIVLGVEPNQLYKYLKTHKLPKLKNLRIEGRIPQAKVPSFYKRADFSLLIRKSNRKNQAGFPTKLAESLMGGCPVIVNYTSDIELFIVNQYNGIVLNNDSTEEIFRAIREVNKLSRDEIINLKKNALRSAHEFFSYQSYIDITDSFLEGLNKN